MSDLVAHSTLLRRGVLLCEESTAYRVVRVDPETGICPRHHNMSCALWYVPWPDVDPKRQTHPATSSLTSDGGPS